MKIEAIYTYLVLLLLTVTVITAQNTNPVVENVTFVNNISTSGMVDIYYDVTDAEQNIVTIIVQASADNGVTYNFAITNVTGDVGGGIETGTNKHIVWNFLTEHPGESGDNCKIKIIANDEMAGGSPCPGTPTVEYEGKSYNTIQIGDQCWLKENLDVGTMINSTAGGYLQTDNGTIEKYCHNNDAANCAIYGGLYEWTEAMQYGTTEGSQGICPTGWHIPTYTELQTLISTVGESCNALKAIGQGIVSGVGTNTSGFSGLLAGYRSGSSGSFGGLNSFTRFWSSTENGSDAGRLGLGSDSDSVNFINFTKVYGFSVRCLKD
ncbi:MAG: hypothetical protein GXX85_16420 [Ignavibacteria bacterium]|nr:hypothetical protein [Ignavibacteria bacterium]